MAHSRGYRIALTAISGTADTGTLNEYVNDGNANKTQNNYSVLEPVQTENNTESIVNENNFNPNSMVVTQDQSNGSLLDIPNISIMFVDEFFGDVSEFDPENYVFIQTSRLNDTIRETTVNVSVNTEQPTLQNKLVDYSSSSESESNEKKISLKSKTLKRFDSDYSFHEERHSDFGFSGSDIEETDDIATDIVGNSGLKKPKRESRKKRKQKEKALGENKSAKENPCGNKRCQNGYNKLLHI